MDIFPKEFELITPEQKGILATLDEFGILAFAVEAGPASSIRGTELFNRMMDHFGDSVVAIHGIWRKGHRPSINIDRVNELTAAGMALDDAIQQTWTVTRAQKRGFLRARMLGQPTGTPGGFTKIEILIEKDS